MGKNYFCDEPNLLLKIESICLQVEEFFTPRFFLIKSVRLNQTRF